MKILECKKEGIYHIGFVDPYFIYDKMILDFPKETEDNLLRFMKKQNTKTEILFPYNYR